MNEGYCPRCGAPYEDNKGTHTCIAPIKLEKKSIDDMLVDIVVELKRISADLRKLEYHIRTKA